MTQRNPYEIRLALLAEARDILFQGWNRKCDAVFHDANIAKRTILHHELPRAPTVEEILAAANRMNEFISKP